METKRCVKCERTINIKRFFFVKVDGIVQRSDTCRLCSRERKRCPMCERELPRSAFCSDKSRPDGLAARCRECARAYERQYRRHKCDTCGTELPKGTRAKRCKLCYRELATRAAAELPPHGVMFPGLVQMKRPGEVRSQEEAEAWRR